MPVVSILAARLSTTSRMRTVGSRAVLPDWTEEDGGANVDPMMGSEVTRSVRLRDGFDLPLSILPHPASGLVELAMRTLDPIVRAAARQLAPPSGQYNCHGLVRASRRGNVGLVGLELDLDDVLLRDGFRPLAPAAEPRVGDVAAYRDAEPAQAAGGPRGGEIEHTGFVTRIERVGSVPVIWVWSAWGGLGEFEHQLGHSPYRGTPEFWRLQ
jgi:hypothetical protein